MEASGLLKVQALLEATVALVVEVLLAATWPLAVEVPPEVNESMRRQCYWKQLGLFW